MSYKSPLMIKRIKRSGKKGNRVASCLCSLGEIILPLGNLANKIDKQLIILCPDTQVATQIFARQFSVVAWEIGKWISLLFWTPWTLFWNMNIQTEFCEWLLWSKNVLKFLEWGQNTRNIDSSACLNEQGFFCSGPHLASYYISQIEGHSLSMVRNWKRVKPLNGPFRAFS